MWQASAGFVAVALSLVVARRGSSKEKLLAKLTLDLEEQRREAEEAKRQLQKEHRERQAERAGRIRAEKELRSLRLQLAAAGFSPVEAAGPQDASQNDTATNHEGVSCRSPAATTAAAAAAAGAPAKRSDSHGPAMVERAAVEARTLQSNAQESAESIGASSGGVVGAEGLAGEGRKVSEKWNEIPVDRKEELQKGPNGAIPASGLEALGEAASGREMSLRAACSLSASSPPAPHVCYPLTPIGILRSCFSFRNGTPRQPLLAPSALAILELTPGGVPAAALQGLEEFSHCWLLYIFHGNTDIGRLWRQKRGAPHSDFKAKVRVPRLSGEKRGALATRTPHRPNPIGISLARVESVKGGTLVLSGADVINGTPVLDVKPYLPYSDSMPEATVPSWVQVSGEEDQMMMRGVEFSHTFKEQLETCWEEHASRSLYTNAAQLKGLLGEVLSRDIRSANRRGKDKELSQILESSNTGVYNVVLDGLLFSYTISQDGTVHVMGAFSSKEGIHQ